MQWARLAFLLIWPVMYFIFVNSSINSIEQLLFGICFTDLLIVELHDSCDLLIVVIFGPSDY